MNKVELNENEKRLLDKILSNCDIKGFEVNIFNTLTDKIFKLFYDTNEVKK